MSDRVRLFQEGYDAFLAGKSVRDCPYRPTATPPCPFTQWYDGYKDARTAAKRHRNIRLVRD